MKHIVFDFDGVLFNSNPLKNECFYSIARQFKFSQIEEFMKYCASAGGVTAEARFDHYLTKICRKDVFDKEELTLSYRSLVRKALAESEPFERMNELECLKQNFTLSIISGGNIDEIYNLLRLHNYLHIFDGLVLGNPKSKLDNFRYFCEQHNPDECIYVGDSMLDYELASKFGMGFRFIYGWSDVQNYETIPKLASTKKYKDLSGLLEEFL